MAQQLSIRLVVRDRSGRGIAGASPPLSFSGSCLYGGRVAWRCQRLAHETRSARRAMASLAGEGA